MNLKNRIAVVTGTSSGIGLHTAGELLVKGAVVYGLSRRRPSIEHERFHWTKADLSVPTAISEAFHTIREREPCIDILVNNAGFGLFGEIETITPEAWTEVIAVNLTAPFLCAREVVPQMKRQSSGTIVNVSSIAGKRGFRQGAAYCASKFGLNGFSEALMEELRVHGVRVCTICPGSTDTSFFKRAGIDSLKRMQPQEVARTIVSAIEMPDDILPDQLVIRPL